MSEKKTKTLDPNVHIHAAADDDVHSATNTTSVVQSNGSVFVQSDAEESFGFLLWQVSSVWQKEIIQVLQPYDVTHPQFVLLASLLWLTNPATRGQTREGKKSGQAIHAEIPDEITQVYLAKHAKMDVMTTSQVLRTLEQKQLIVRSAHSKDSRAKVLKLTDAGQQLAHTLVPQVEEADRRFFAKLQKTQTHITAIQERAAMTKEPLTLASFFMPALQILKNQDDDLQK